MADEPVTPAEVGGLVDTLRSMSRDDNTRACVSVNITVSNDLAKKLFDVLHAAPKAATVLEALSAENGRLRKALKPFAKAAAHHEAFSGDRPVRSDGDVLVSHLRTARRALEGGE